MHSVEKIEEKGFKSPDPIFNSPFYTNYDQINEMPGKFKTPKKYERNIFLKSTSHTPVRTQNSQNDQLLLIKGKEVKKLVVHSSKPFKQQGFSSYNFRSQTRNRSIPHQRTLYTENYDNKLSEIKSTYNKITNFNSHFKP